MTGFDDGPKIIDSGGGGPNETASRTPSQPSAACGAANRSSPTGGLANGMPRKTARPFSMLPRTSPVVVRTTSGPLSIMGTMLSRGRTIRRARF